jgi:hypothetical protein
MAPFITAETARLMLAPPSAFTKQLGIPSWVMNDVYFGNAHHDFIAAAVQPLFETFRALDLVTPTTEPLWQLLGIGPAQRTRNLLPSARIRQLPR